jgi:lipoyl(octanoyl) transferase
LHGKTSFGGIGKKCLQAIGFLDISAGKPYPALAYLCPSYYYIMQEVLFRDLGQMEYGAAWEYQEKLLQQNVALKQEYYAQSSPTQAQQALPATKHHLLFCEHPPVYTLGKSGDLAHILLSEAEMAARRIGFFRTNRGGDITFHGPQQIVAYPILDLEYFGTDIGKYLRHLEEVIIRTLAHYGLQGARSAGETGVWLEPDVKGKERKICAMGVRCSRWITMHGLAFNVNTDLSYFDHIIPCGIKDKQVTSLQKELGRELDFNEVKKVVKQKFEEVFECRLKEG